MLRFIIPFGPCSPQKYFRVGCFQMEHEATERQPVFSPRPYSPTNMNTTTLSINITEEQTLQVKNAKQPVGHKQLIDSFTLLLS